MSCNIKRIKGCEIAGSTFNGRKLSLNRDFSNDTFKAKVKTFNQKPIAEITGVKNATDVYFPFNGLENLSAGLYIIEYWGNFEDIGNELFCIEEFSVVAPSKAGEAQCCDNYNVFNFVTEDISIDIQITATIVNIGGNVDLSNYYTKDETYSKTEVDDIISDIPVVDTSNLVPYTGATKDVNIDSNYFETSQGFKKTGGTANQALTADGGTFDLNEKADLVDGKVPSSQLPSYVDDVLEFANLASFPATGESGKIYIAIDTNITYRWTGTGYAEISASLALGETANTAYRGDRGKIAYDHSLTTGNPHGTTATDVDALKRDGSNANSNINIGEFQLKAGQIELDQTPTQPFGVGMIRWNDTDGTAEIRLKGNNVTLQLGQELVKRVVNKSGANLLESQYKVVKVVGATGQRLSIDLAQANNELNSATTIGMVTENINNNQEGFITYNGEVNGINTTGSLQGETWVDGDVLYLSPSVAGGVTKVKPTAPNHVVIVGYVEYAHVTQGKIFIKIDNGYELDEIHNVNTSLSKTNPVDADNLLIQDSADSSIWKKISWANIKATLKTYFDNLYAPKAFNVKVTTPSSYVTGTMSETEVLRIEIPANSLSASDVLRIPFLMVNKVGTNGTIIIRGKLSTSATMPSGSTDQLFQTVAVAATNQYIALDRQFIIENGQIKGYPFTTGGYSGIGINGTQIASKAFDRTVTNYLYISVTLSNINDQARFEGMQLTNS